VFWLKEFAERDLGYMTSGLFTAAAMCAGVPWRADPESTHILLGVRQRSITALEQQAWRGLVDPQC